MTDGLDQKFHDRDAVFRRLSRAMSHYFVGPIPPKKFLDSFLPKDPHAPSSSTFEPGMLSGLKDAGSEGDMYTKFSQIVSPCLSGESGLNLVNTSCKKDHMPHPNLPFLCQPDCYVYEANRGHNHPDSSLVECLIEFKTTSDYDPFVRSVPSEPMSPAMGRNTFMSANSRGVKAAGQITAHATLILGAQYRTHIFLILILREYSRIVRWDRGGAVVTAPIYHDEGHVLDFLIRFKDASPQARGRDITVEPASDKELEEARDVKELTNATSLLSLSIPDHSSSIRRRYIVEAPRPELDVPVGRWTRVSIAYDVQRRKRVFLKDSWRVMLEGSAPEGEIYARLHKHSVPNIPTCSQAGYIGNELYHASRTHEFDTECGHSAHVMPYRHYRLVLDTIGRPLETFNRSHELVKAVYDALLAHEAAYKAGILHCDISPGNIMIVDDKDEPNIPRGILIDWDLCKSVGQEDERQNSRTGTWLFMAADIVVSPNVVHTFIHDVESAFWVLIWMTCTYLPISWDVGQRSSFLMNTMNPRIYLDTGGGQKMAFLTARSLLDSFTVIGNDIFTSLLLLLMDVLRVRHLPLPRAPSAFDVMLNRERMDDQDLESRIEMHKESMDLLKDHKFVLSMFEQALQFKDWPEHDRAELQPTVMPNYVEISMGSISNRSTDMAEEDDVYVSLPAAKRSATA